MILIYVVMDETDDTSGQTLVFGYIGANLVFFVRGVFFVDTILYCATIPRRTKCIGSVDYIGRGIAIAVVFLTYSLM